MNDRIKLAEAMGWKWSLRNVHYKTGQWTSPDGTEAEVWCYHDAIPFDPFTDANDDYAVLEWMRKTHAPNGDRVWQKFRSHLHLQERYNIGDYARAALKVLE